MSDILTKIISTKRDEISQRKKNLSLSSLESRIKSIPEPRGFKKSLLNSINRGTPAIIAECKKASPSKGLIREKFDLDEILAAYTPFAAGISVLTDEKYFQGKFEYLAYVTERVSQPVLNKDFFVCEYQVYLARYYNADAILLMLSVLDDETYQQLAAVADSLGLDILTEVSNEEEMHRAIALKAKIIGINNRDLRDLSTDLATTEKLVPMLKDATHEHVVISESGIYTHQDVLRLAPLCQRYKANALAALFTLNRHASYLSRCHQASTPHESVFFSRCQEMRAFIIESIHFLRLRHTLLSYEYF